MAFLKKVDLPCGWGGCPNHGNYEVFNVKNASDGRYCLKHARERIKVLEGSERRLAAVEAMKRSHQ